LLDPAGMFNPHLDSTTHCGTVSSAGHPVDFSDATAAVQAAIRFCICSGLGMVDRCPFRWRAGSYNRLILLYYSQLSHRCSVLHVDLFETG
jgi:hypothetical protein